MKVTIENIIGSAKRIQGERQQQRQGRDDSAQVRADSVSIEHRTDARLADIQSELRDIQKSLTRNQVVEDGVARLRTDLRQGGENAERILDETRFEGARVLASFVGEHPDAQTVEASMERVRRMVRDDVMRLRKLQVEAENILAAGNASESVA